METLEVDVLVVGAGAAGLRAAIEAATSKARVLVLCKGAPGGGTSTVMSGGVFRGASRGGTPGSHLSDTLRAGRGINQGSLVEILVRESPGRLQELLDWGLQGEARGGYLFASGAAPAWGKPIVDCLRAKAQSAGVDFMGSTLAARIIRFSAGLGLLAYRIKDGKWMGILCGSMVLATGGAGALYARHDNPQGMLGGGYSLALEAGAQLQDMEFVQFYPLGLAEPGLPSLLIPPRLADKGLLCNGRGEELLGKHGIQERPAAERARDRLSKAIFSELRGGEEVWLDLREVGERAWMEDPLSASCRHLLWERYGGAHRPLRVAPMAHFLMGGISIHGDGSTHVPGLFAAGEVAGGLHGANRLGGNALAETLVFGARAGRAAALWAGKGPGKQQGGGALEEGLHSLLASLPQPRAVELRGWFGKIRQCMWEKGGILRNRQGLQEALGCLEDMAREVGVVPNSPDPLGLARTLEARLAVRTGLVILEAALRREESRGAHFREDFPQQDDTRWLGHLLVKQDEKGGCRWGFEPASPCPP